MQTAAVNAACNLLSDADAAAAAAFCLRCITQVDLRQHALPPSTLVPPMLYKVHCTALRLRAAVAAAQKKNAAAFDCQRPE